MKDKILIIILLTIIVILMKHCCSESFADKNTKAQALYTWFNNNSAPSYTNYKQNFQDDANIVEYEDVLNLAQKNMLSVPNIVNII